MLLQLLIALGDPLLQRAAFVERKQALGVPRSSSIETQDRSASRKETARKFARTYGGFAELAKDALAYSKAHKRSYGDDVIRMEKLLSSFRERSAESITPRELERFLAQNAEENDWAPATINRYRALLSLVYRLGIENGKVRDNPARLVKHRQENNARARYLSAEDETRLRAYIQATCPEHIHELDLALHTGMRLGEMYSLTWENVNMSRKVLTIPRSKNGEKTPRTSECNCIICPRRASQAQRRHRLGRSES